MRKPSTKAINVKKPRKKMKSKKKQDAFMGFWDYFGDDRIFHNLPALYRYITQNRLHPARFRL
jgi:hypothetical protein